MRREFSKREIGETSDRPVKASFYQSGALFFPNPFGRKKPGSQRHRGQELPHFYSPFSAARNREREEKRGDFMREK